MLLTVLDSLSPRAASHRWATDASHRCSVKSLQEAGVQRQRRHCTRLRLALCADMQHLVCEQARRVLPAWGSLKALYHVLLTLTSGNYLMRAEGWTPQTRADSKGGQAHRLRCQSRLPSSKTREFYTRNQNWSDRRGLSVIVAHSDVLDTGQFQECNSMLPAGEGTPLMTLLTKVGSASQPGHIPSC